MAKKLRSAKHYFPERECASTAELAKVFGLSVDFYRKLAAAGSVAYTRAGVGPKARVMINLEDFDRWRAESSKKPGADQCASERTKQPAYGKIIGASGTRGKGAKAKNTTSASILKVKHSLANARNPG